MTGSPARAIVKRIITASLAGGISHGTDLTVAGHEAIDRDELLVHDWRVKQLKASGIPGHLAEGAAASHVD